jgi:hypothetical protein
MVLFVDLEDESEPPEQIRGNHWPVHDNAGVLRSLSLGNSLGVGRDLKGDEEGGARENPNKNVLTEALGCYPYVLPLVTTTLLTWIGGMVAYPIATTEL